MNISGKHILVDGSFQLTEEYQISLSEIKGLLFSERIRAVRTNFPFFLETLEIIKLKLLIFNLSFPEFTHNDGAGLKRQLERTITKNKHFGGAELIVSFCRVDQQIHYAIQSKKLKNADYELNEKGLHIGIFDKIQKPISSLSSISLGSKVYWDITQRHIDESRDVLAIINTSDFIVETPESNIYLIKGKSVRGASCEHGAYLDITQPLMREIFHRLKLHYSESDGITTEDIRLSEEIMVVNALEGVRWIAGFEGKRFFNNTIKKISELFNQSITS